MINLLKSVAYLFFDIIFILIFKSQYSFIYDFIINFKCNGFIDIVELTLVSFFALYIIMSIFVLSIKSIYKLWCLFYYIFFSNNNCEYDEVRILLDHENKTIKDSVIKYAGTNNEEHIHISRLELYAGTNTSVDNNDDECYKTDENEEK